MTMTLTFSNELLSRFSDVIATNLALHFPESRWNDLERLARILAKEAGAEDPEAFITEILSAPLNNEQIEFLANHLTINESFFWREPHVFEALMHQILPEIINDRKDKSCDLRLWSAGCSTGEEPYSLAIALHKILTTISDWNIHLLATDICPHAMHKAKTGQYREWSFRNTPTWLIHRYFNDILEKKREIIPEIRQMVKFVNLNLANDSYPSTENDTNDMDIIFCRNVLMYFTPDHANAVIQRLFDSLKIGGWLIVSASELSPLRFSQFEAVTFPGAILYQKKSVVVDNGLGKDKLRITEDFLASSGLLSAENSRRNNLNNSQQFSPERKKISSDSLQPQLSRPQPAPLVKLINNLKIKQPEVPQSHIPESAIHNSQLDAVRDLANQGHLDEALALCNDALTTDKLSAGLHFLRATILHEMNRVDDAITSLHIALYLDPNFILVHFLMGNIARFKDDKKTADRYFKNVLSLLTTFNDADILPESDGLIAGHFREIIYVTLGKMVRI